MNQQPIKSQKAEVEFRKELVQQQTEGKHRFDDEFDDIEIEKELERRMRKTLAQMTRLASAGVSLSPYIEIGAERCQRSLVMENDLKAEGISVDISYDMLKSCDYYRKRFTKEKKPMRICCDANELPFKSNSVPFIFCYQTIHHFQDIIPVIQKIHRVISPGGHFFFDEEPYKRMLHINLYKTKKLYSKESINSSRIREAIDWFFAKKNCNEVDYGIIENNDILINTWKSALSSFEKRDVELHSVVVSKLHRPNYLNLFLAYSFGGNISGLCQKSRSGANGVTKSIHDLFICPSCLEKNIESELCKNDCSFICNTCHSTYPVIDDIIFLFTKDSLRQLYPQIANRIFNGA